MSFPAAAGTVSTTHAAARRLPRNRVSGRKAGEVVDPSPDPFDSNPGTPLGDGGRPTKQAETGDASGLVFQDKAPNRPSPPTNYCKRCEELEEQVFALEEKLAAFETRNPYLELPASLHMRPQANRILKLLFCNGPLAKRAIFEALYAGDPDGGPEQKIVDVLVCYMRHGLRGTGVNIRTIWGFGYEMTAYNKARLAELIEEAKRNA